MKKRVFVVLTISVVSLAIFFMPFLFEERQKSEGEHNAVLGRLDASAWDIEHTPIIQLNGEWEFYWGELLTSEDFNVERVAGYMQVPSLWNGKILNGEELPAFGCATYRLIVENVSGEGVLGLKKANARFSSKVYVNGELLISDGKPALQSADYQSGNTPMLGFFQNDSGSIEIIVQVANFEYMNSGIPVSLELGKADDINYKHQKGYLLGVTVFILLLAITFLFIIFFVIAWFRGATEYLLPLFLLFCFLFAVGNALTDQRPLLLFLPDLSFTLVFKMKDFFLSANFIVAICIFHRFEKTLLTPWPAKIISYGYAVYLIAIILLPIHVYYEIHKIVMACNTVILLILLLRSVHLYLRKAKGLLLLIAILSANYYSADAILFSLGLRTSSSFTQVYIMFFAVVMMLLLSMQYFDAISRLQQSVMRTQEAEIAFLRAQINPHFLYNTLNSIAALCREAPDKAEDVVVELSLYLRRSFDFKRLDSMTTLSTEKELLDAYLYIEKVRFGERLKIEYDIEDGLNLALPPMILQPLVENAVQHGLMGKASGGTVTISIRTEGDTAVFTIADDGIGMGPNLTESLLVENDQSDKKGIGLWNINRRLKIIYGQGLKISSEKGRGTSVTFTLPLRQSMKQKRKVERH